MEPLKIKLKGEGTVELPSTERLIEIIKDLEAKIRSLESELAKYREQHPPLLMHGDDYVS